jgi:Zn-dependent M28 family amino/carboxypeptidase
VSRHLPVRLRASMAIALATLVLGLPVEAAPSSSNNNSAKLREAVTLEGVRRHQAAWQEIAEENGGNRFAGFPGHDASVDYVVNQLEAAGLSPTTQTFTYVAFSEDTPTELDRVSPTATTYVNGTDYRIMSYSGEGEFTAPLAIPTGDSRGCVTNDWTGFPSGSIALVERGTPAGYTNPATLNACTFRVKAENAAAAGAVAVIIYNNIAGVLNGTLGQTSTTGVPGLSSIPAVGILQSLGQSLRSQVQSGPVTMHVMTDTSGGLVDTENVFTEIRGTTNPDNVVMVGAHLDSVAAGPGINDNGSGSAAILETAIQMAKVHPRNTVRFAWWSAEESGLVGSTYYVNNLPAAEREKIALYLNFDMIGSPNFARFVYDGDNSAGGGSVGPAGSAQIEQLFVDYFNSQGLASAPTPFNGRSDYGPFIARGIPAGGLFTGAEGIKTAAQANIFGGTAGVAFDVCYHALCDTLANVDTTGLDQMSDAVAHAVITYAQNTEAVNQVKGKGNFRPGSSNASNGGGAGGGGGLHDDHGEDPA